ncbi:MAG: glycosyltransferase [Bacteroidales bacterium]|nr:glycosyltransferase [Bacteroidales bacterium]
MKKLSIVIPVYKVEDYVGQCLQSVFDGGCDESKYEVIVVNDGTPDKSMDVVRRVCEGHGNVQIIQQENHGLSAARMTGLAHAEGEYVWFVDSDDWLEAGAVDSIIRILLLHSGISVLAMPLIWISKSTTRYENDFKDVIAHKGKDLLQEGYPLSAIQRYIIHRDVFKNKSVYFPRGLIHEDEYFYRTMLYNAPEVLVLESSFYYYRQREKSIMSSRSIRSCHDVVSVYRLLEGFLNSSVDHQDKKWFKRSIVSLLLHSYKYSYSITSKKEAEAYRRKYRWYVLRQGLFCYGFSIKERLWIVSLTLFPILLDTHQR